MRTVTDVTGEWRHDRDADPRALRVVECATQGAIDVRIPVERPVLLGREPGPKGVSLKDARISSKHLAVYPDEAGRLCFRDLGSKNGTRHNGHRATGGYLAEGDVLRLGSTFLVVTRRGPAVDLEDAAAGRVGQAPGFREACERLALAARGDAPAPILILGETGAGKEGLARLVHEVSRRHGRTGAFVAVNCAALSEQLADAALFGHQRGAFTGATQARPGFFREAEGGTLCLDEIAEMPLPIQARLLRALEQREIVPVGASRPVTVDVRVVAATNVDLAAAVADGRFRADLYARLNGWPVHAPPLRERREDILRIARWFAGRPPGDAPYADAPLFDPDLAEALLLYPWPYNVRELRQIVGALVAGGPPPWAPDELPRPLVSGSARVTASAPAPVYPSASGVVSVAPLRLHEPTSERAALSGVPAPAPVSDLPLPSPAPAPASGVVSVAPLRLREPTSERAALSGVPAPAPVPDLPLPSRRKRPSKAALLDALAAHQQNISAVARWFDRDRRQIYRWLERYGIALDELGDA